MKNLILQRYIRGRIDERVDRLLTDLGQPEPPLRLEEVRELLKLDRAYYTGDEDGFLHETVHRLKLAGKQVLARPTLVLDAIRKFSLKALYVPDRRRILIDDNLPKPKHRWIEGHEIIHEVLDWHLPVLRGDDELSLKQSCLAKVEAEANYGAGQLLFLRRRFIAEVLDSQPSLELVRNLKKSFGNTHASTLWRLVETAGVDRPLFGVIHDHPHPRFRANHKDPAHPCRHFIQSDAFGRQFSNVTEDQVYGFIGSYCGAQKGGPLGESVALISSDNGEKHEFAFETFCLIHECLTLGIHLRKHVPVVGVGC